MDLQKCPLTYEERHNMIAETAFFKYKQRGYPSDPVKDWLEAETELDEALAAFCRTAEQDQEISAYRRVRLEVRRILEKAEETVNAETIAQALAKVKTELRQLGEYFPATIDRAAKTVKDELSGTIDKLGHNWETFRIKQSELLAGWKEKRAHNFQEWLGRWRKKDEH